MNSMESSISMIDRLMKDKDEDNLYKEIPTIGKIENVPLFNKTSKSKSKSKSASSKPRYIKNNNRNKFNEINFSSNIEKKFKIIKTNRIVTNATTSCSKYTVFTAILVIICTLGSLILGR